MNRTGHQLTAKKFWWPKTSPKMAPIAPPWTAAWKKAKAAPIAITACIHLGIVVAPWSVMK